MGTITENLGRAAGKGRNSAADTEPIILLGGFAALQLYRSADVRDIFSAECMRKLANRLSIFCNAMCLRTQSQSIWLTVWKLSVDCPFSQVAMLLLRRGSRFLGHNLDSVTAHRESMGTTLHLQARGRL